MPIDFFGGPGVSVAGYAGDDMKRNIFKHFCYGVMSYRVGPEFRDAGLNGKASAKRI